MTARTGRCPRCARAPDRIVHVLAASDAAGDVWFVAAVCTGCQTFWFTQTAGVSPPCDHTPIWSCARLERCVNVVPLQPPRDSQEEVDAAWLWVQQHGLDPAECDPRDTIRRYREAQRGAA